MAKLLSPETGLTPLAALDEAGMKTVLDLRNRYTQPDNALASVAPYLDLTHYDRATTSDTT